MARTLANAAEEISPGTITRALLNTATAGSALITKIIAGGGLAILGSTGADVGTGDVTVGSANSNISIITANTTAVVNACYQIEASSVTLTLPSSPTKGQTVGVMVPKGYTGCIVNPNGAYIMAVSGNMNINVQPAWMCFVYVDSTNGWQLS